MIATILTVDDSSSMRQMVRAALEADGHQVHEAASGDDALATLAALASPVDLIITDLYMPGMDGLTLVQCIRGIDSYRFTPVLLLTTESGADMKQRGRAAGATGWLVKPFKPEQLRQVVGRVLGNGRPA